jgi:hypothetical protein
MGNTFLANGAGQRVGSTRWRRAVTRQSPVHSWKADAISACSRQKFRRSRGAKGSQTLCRFSSALSSRCIRCAAGKARKARPSAVDAQTQVPTMPATPSSAIASTSQRCRRSSRRGPGCPAQSAPTYRCAVQPRREVKGDDHMAIPAFATAVPAAAARRAGRFRVTPAKRRIGGTQPLQNARRSGLCRANPRVSSPCPRHDPCRDGGMAPGRRSSSKSLP